MKYTYDKYIMFQKIKYAYHTCTFCSTVKAIKMTTKKTAYVSHTKRKSK